MLWTTFVMALRQLRRNKVRTALTSLGILIGVAAVISMVSIGRSATHSVESDLSSLGQNLLFVVPGSHGNGPPGPAKPFTQADVNAVINLPGVANVAPMASQGAVAIRGEETTQTVVQGSTNELFVMMRWSLAEGRMFTEGEQIAGANVCLLGQTVRSELFGAQSPLGRDVRVGALTCRVVGLLSPRGQSTFGQDQDNFILVPLATYQRRLQGSRDISMIFVSGAAGVDTSNVKSALEGLFRQRRHIREGADDDFTVRDMREVASMLSSISAVLTGFLAAIAGVSLLVGGIGIMNIMLVSVTERTREIGIRLAIGALARDVLLQFLVEAMVLSGVGGLVGIVLGLLVSWGAAAALKVDLVIDAPVVFGAFVFSGFIGIVFGFFPARRAAKMKPIDALRHE